MESTVSQQLLTFLWSILLGLAAGLLYDLLRPFRLRLPRLTAALDLLYCLTAGSAVFSAPVPEEMIHALKSL